MYKTINKIILNLGFKISILPLKNLNNNKSLLFNVKKNKINEKSQNFKYLKKLNDDKIYFYRQYSFKTLGNDLKIIKILLKKQKNKKMFTLFDKSKKDKVLHTSNVDISHNIKNQIYQMFLFKEKKNDIDIFPTEDILFHPNVIKLLAIAVIKGIFKLYLKISSSNSLNKFSFVVYYETFDGNPKSLAFPSNFVLTKNDAKLLNFFHTAPEKISFYNPVLNFILYLTEKYEGTSFYKISVISTCIKWDSLKKAFNSR